MRIMYTRMHVGDGVWPRNEFIVRSSVEREDICDYTYRTSGQSGPERVQHILSDTVRDLERKYSRENTARRAVIPE
jgi:hypothetical protein